MLKTILLLSLLMAGCSGSALEKKKPLNSKGPSTSNNVQTEKSVVDVGQSD